MNNTIEFTKLTEDEEFEWHQMLLEFLGVPDYYGTHYEYLTNVLGYVPEDKLLK